MKWKKNSISSDTLLVNTCEHSSGSIQGDCRFVINFDWIVLEKFQAETQASPIDIWLLVYYSVRYYTKALRKVRVPAYAASDMSSQSDRAGAYLWAIVQSHWVSQMFVSHRWRYYPAVSSVIDYHLFRFMVSLNAHNRLKLKFGTLQKFDNYRQAENSKLAIKLKFLEGKGYRKTKWYISTSPLLLLLVVIPLHVNNVLWLSNKEFPRQLSQQALLSVAVTVYSFYQGSGVSGSLSVLPSVETVGIIASEWVEWLPVLSFVLHSPVWVWIFDKTWERLSRRLYPLFLFINGFVDHLPLVDVLHLSKITLPQCSISLSTSMASLILSTSRLHYIFSGWSRRF